MSRQSGYYWVKDKPRGAWVPAKYNGCPYNSWVYTGNTFRAWKDSEFYQINETRILAPDEVSDERICNRR